MLMRQRAINQRNLDQLLLGCLGSLGYSRSNLASLAKPHTDDTLAVSDDNNGSETKSTTTLGDLDNPVDCHQTILKLKIIRIPYSLQIVCHRY